MPNIRMLHICYFVSAVIIYHKYVFCEYINTERQKKCMSKEKEPSPLGRELETYQTEGIPLWLNGKPSTPEEIVHACMIEEEGTYMRDYVQNERGKIKKRRNIKIKCYRSPLRHKRKAAAFMNKNSESSSLFDFL